MGKAIYKSIKDVQVARCVARALPENKILNG
jgi:hypothetical protein